MDIIEPLEKKPFENVLPLVNIVFLLLIFFMIAGTLIKPEALLVTVPEASVSQAAAQGPLIIVMDAQQQFSVEKTLYKKDELMQFITSTIKDSKPLVVQLKADSRIASKDIIDFMDALGATGLESIRLLTTHPLPKK